MEHGYPESPNTKQPLWRGLQALLSDRHGIDVTRIDWQSERELIATDVRSGAESVITTYPPGPWVCVDFADGKRYAIWKATGEVFALDDSGAVGEDPVLFDQETM